MDYNLAVAKFHNIWETDGFRKEVFFLSNKQQVIANELTYFLLTYMKFFKVWTK